MFLLAVQTLQFPKSFFGISNPIFFSILIVGLVLILTYFYYRYVVIPMRKKHLEEQRNIRLEQAELMALFAESDPNPVIRVDNSGKIMLTNNAAVKINENFANRGQHISEIFKNFTSVDFQKVVKDGKRVEIEDSINNRHFTFVIQGISRLNIAHVYGKDITELKLAEMAIKEALMKIEKSEQLKTNFLAQLSHEIRSPLTALMGYSSMIKDELSDKIGEDMKGAFLAIDNNAKRLYRTIDLIINMSQVLTGEYKVSKSNFNVVDELNILKYEFDSMAEQKKLDFKFNFDIKKPFIYYDMYAFGVIVGHIIENAIKYTKTGSVTVNANENDNEITVNVKDTGIGISEEYKEKLFTPFTQEIMGYNRPFEGNGLGLALVKNLFNLVGGSISLKSKKDEGSTFTLIFPRTI